MVADWTIQPGGYTPTVYTPTAAVNAICGDGTYLYLALADGTIAKVVASTMVLSVLSSATTGVPSAICVAAGKVYVGNTNTLITRLTASSMAIDTTVALAAGSTVVTGLVVAGTSLYAVCTDSLGSSNPGTVAKVLVSAFTLTTTLTLSAGQCDPRCVATDGSSLFIGTATAPAAMVKVGLAAFTVAASVAIPGGVGAVYSVVYESAFSLSSAFFAINGAPSQLIRVRKDTWEVYGPVLTLPAALNNATSIAYYNAGEGRYLYMAGTANPWVAQIDISQAAPRLSRQYPLGGSYTGVRFGPLVADGTYVYVGTNAGANAAIQIDPTYMGLVLTAIFEGALNSERKNRVDFFDAIGRNNQVAVQYLRAGRQGDLVHLVWPQADADTQNALLQDQLATLELDVAYFTLTDLFGEAMTVVLGDIKRELRAATNFRLRFPWTVIDYA